MIYEISITMKVDWRVCAELIYGDSFEICLSYASFDVVTKIWLQIIDWWGPSK